MQRLMKISFIRNHLFNRAVGQFVQEQETRGVMLRSEDVAERLADIRTVLVDAPLVMQGDHAVRQVAAPLAPCDLSRIKHQPSWMMLAAGVSLGCDGYAPLESFARALNFARERMAQQYPQVDAFRFDEVRGIETTVHRDAAGFRAYTKGSTEAVLAYCGQILDGRERPLTQEDLQRVKDADAKMQAEGLETLAFATSWNTEGGEFEKDMVFLGIIGIGDVPRPNVPWSMQALRNAGIRPVMVSADVMAAPSVHVSGIMREPSGMMYAEEVDALNDVYLAEAAMRKDAFLGLDWPRKRRLIHALRSEGMVVTAGPEPQSGGVVLAIGGGQEPDVIIEKGGLDAVVRLLGDCRALTEAYQAR